MDKQYVIGVDVGGTNILTILADEQGQVLAELEIPTLAAQGGQCTVERVLASVKNVMQQVELNERQLWAVAVGVPGQVDVHQGWVYFCPNLDWTQLPLVQILRQQLPVPVYIENDGNAAALGEQVFGAGAGCSNLVYITVGTGVGGGIIINKAIYRGTGSAGELGHMTIMPNGPRCGCGNQGCLEALASGRAITTAAQQAADQGRGQAILQAAQHRQGQIDVRTVVAAAHQGDSQSKTILAGAARALGMGVANIINLLSPQRVIFGGGVMKSRQLLWPLMEKEVATRTLSTPWKQTQLLPGLLGGRAGALGLVALALQQR